MFSLDLSQGIAYVHLNGSDSSVEPEQWSKLPGILSRAESEGACAVVFSGVPGRDFYDEDGALAKGCRGTNDALRSIGYLQCAMQCVAHGKLFAVAALSGAVMGPGLVLASACDIRVATPDARLGLPDVQGGTYGGYALLSRQMPAGVARLMALTGMSISGRRAYDIGFVQELGETQDAVLAHATAISRHVSEILVGPLREGLKAVMNRQDEANRWQAYQIERVFTADAIGNGRRPI